MLTRLDFFNNLYTIIKLHLNNKRDPIFDRVVLLKFYDYFEKTRNNNV